MNITDQIQTELGFFKSRTNREPKKIFLGQKEWEFLRENATPYTFYYNYNYKFPDRPRGFSCDLYPVDDESYIGILD